jgi:hypothetical protein
MSVLVEGATEAFVPAYVETSDLYRIGDRRGEWVQGAGVGDALMRPMGYLHGLRLYMASDMG